MKRSLNFKEIEKLLVAGYEIVSMGDFKWNDDRTEVKCDLELKPPGGESKAHGIITGITLDEGEK